MPRARDLADRRHDGRLPRGCRRPPGHHPHLGAVPPVGGNAARPAGGCRDRRRRSARAARLRRGRLPAPWPRRLRLGVHRRRHAGRIDGPPAGRIARGGRQGGARRPARPGRADVRSALYAAAGPARNDRKISALRVLPVRNGSARAVRRGARLRRAAASPPRGRPAAAAAGQHVLHAGAGAAAAAGRRGVRRAPRRPRRRASARPLRRRIYLRAADPCRRRGYDLGRSP